MRCRCPNTAHARGQAIVEFALAVPVFLLLVLGVLDFGRAVYIKNTITNAAREGARYGIIAPTPTTAVVSRVQTFAPTLGIPTASITVSCSDAGGCASAAAGDTITVAVSYPYTPLVATIAGFTGASLSLASSTTMTVQ